MITIGMPLGWRSADRGKHALSIKTTSTLCCSPSGVTPQEQGSIDSYSARLNHAATAFHMCSDFLDRVLGCMGFYLLRIIIRHNAAYRSEQARSTTESIRRDIREYCNDVIFSVSESRISGHEIDTQVLHGLIGNLTPLLKRKSFYQIDRTERTFILTSLTSPSEKSLTSKSGVRGNIWAVIVDSPWPPNTSTDDQSSKTLSFTWPFLSAESGAK
jgi:hypothetical protein